MTTETRVGIVAGLMIVVAASVYFFYGNNAGDDDILVATPTRVSLPPKIPPAADAPKVAQKRPAAPQRVTRAPRRTPTATSTDQLAQSAPPMRPIRPTAQPKPAAAEIAPAVKSPETPVVLRTAPSTELVEATSDNLRDVDVPNSDNPPVKEPMKLTLTPPQPAPRGAPKVASEATTVIDITPTRTLSDSRARPSLREMPRENWARKHTVIEGDTLTDISKLYFGDTTRADEILAANPQIKSARHLKIGDVLTLPEPKDATARPVAPANVAYSNAHLSSPATSPPGEPGRTYTVQSGDTLYSIARKQYGNSNRWEEIFRLNKSALKNNPARLTRGMVLQLPP